MDNASQQVPPAESQQSTKTSKNLTFFKTLAYGFVIASIGISIAVGGYLLGISKTKPQPSAQISLSPTPTPDPTASWKTYTNTKYGFSFKYPENLYLRSDSTDKNIGFLEIQNRNDSQKLVLTVQDNQNNLTLKDFTEKNKPIPDDRKNISYETSKINGYDSLIERYELPCLGICDNFKSSKHFIYFIKGKDFIVSFSAQNNNPVGNNPEEEKWLDQILSTFQFSP